MMMQMDPEESIQTKFMKEAAEEPEKVEIEAKEFDESHRFAMYDDNNPVSCIDPDEVIHIDLESDLSIDYMDMYNFKGQIRRNSG